MNQNVRTNGLIKQLANKVDAMTTHKKMLKTQIFQVAQQQAGGLLPILVLKKNTLSLCDFCILIINYFLILRVNCLMILLVFN